MGRGANFAFQSIRTDFFLLLSPDTKIEENSILKLYSTALNNDNCAISAPLNFSDPNSFGILPEKRSLYEKNKNVASIFSYHVNDPSRYGVVEFSENKRIKPQQEGTSTSNTTPRPISSKHEAVFFRTEANLCRTGAN